LIKEATGTGITVEEAFENAKMLLNAPDEVTVEHEIIDEGKKKTFGLFGGTPAKVRVFYNVSPFSEAEEYITAILHGMGVSEVKMEIEEADGTVQIQLDCGKDQGTVIGRRGEVLDAIQYLTRLIINKESDNYKRVSINIGSYREKREETLKDLAKKNAAKVKKYGRSVALDPMNPYERRVIHTAIQEIDGVTSHSVGNGNERKVIITSSDGGYKGGRGRDSKDGFKGKQGNKRYGDSPKEYPPREYPPKEYTPPKDSAPKEFAPRDFTSREYPPKEYAPKDRDSAAQKEKAQPKKEPRSGSAPGSLYGKIEPKQR